MEICCLSHREDQILKLILFPNLWVYGGLRLGFHPKKTFQSRSPLSLLN